MRENKETHGRGCRNGKYRKSHKQMAGDVTMIFAKKKSAAKSPENYLEYIPEKSSLLAWDTDEEGIVTLHMENTGFFNRLAQKYFHKPRVTHVHLDKLGSFVWPLIDGEKDMVALGKEVDARFGGECAPLYERLAKFFQVLESYHFVILRKK